MFKESSVPVWWCESFLTELDRVTTQHDDATKCL